MEYIQNNSQIIPCPLNLGWEIVKTIEITKINDNNEFLGGFSAISYLENKDTLFLLSDNPRGYLAKIDSFSEILNSSLTTLNATQLDILKLKNKNGKNFFKKMDGEGLWVDGSSAFIINESNYWHWRKPLNIYLPPSVIKYDLQTGRAVDFIKLPNSWKYGTSGIESLTNFGSGNILVATEGRNYNIHYRHRIIKLLNRFPFFREKINNKTESYESTRYASFNLFNKKAKFSNFKSSGKVRDLLSLNDYRKVIVMSTSSNIVFLNLHKTAQKRNNIEIKEQIFKWEVPAKEKREGISKGPKIRHEKNTILLVSDNDNGNNSVIAILAPNIKKNNCEPKTLEKDKYVL